MTRIICLYILVAEAFSLSVNAQFVDTFSVVKTILKSDSYNDGMKTIFESRITRDGSKAEIIPWHWTRLNIEKTDSQYIFSGDSLENIFWHKIPVSNNPEWIKYRTMDDNGNIQFKVRPCVFDRFFGDFFTSLCMRFMGEGIDCYQQIETYITDSSLITKLWKNECGVVVYSEVYSFNKNLLEQVTIDGEIKRKYVFDYDRKGRMKSIGLMHKYEYVKRFSVEHRQDNSVVIKSYNKNSKSRMKLELSSNICFNDLIFNKHTLFYFKTCPFRNNLSTWLW